VGHAAGVRSRSALGSTRTQELLTERPYKYTEEDIAFRPIVLAQELR
jgi:hypothetical protein